MQHTLATGYTVPSLTYSIAYITIWYSGGCFAPLGSKDRVLPQVYVSGVYMLSPAWWVSTRYPGILPQSEDTQIWLTGISSLKCVSESVHASELQWIVMLMSQVPGDSLQTSFVVV